MDNEGRLLGGKTLGHPNSSFFWGRALQKRAKEMKNACGGGKKNLPQNQRI